MDYSSRIMKITNPYVRALYKYHYREVHRNNFGFFGIYTGRPGNGKTEQAILHSWIEDDTFNEDTLKERVCSDPKMFLKGINEFDAHSWLMWMDAGISTSLSARNWQKITNTLVNDTTMLMRIKKMGVLFDSQMFGFIDKTTRSLFQWYMEVRRFENRSPVLSVHRIDVNQREGKVYFPYPVFNINNRLVKLTKMTVNGRLPKRMRDEFDGIHMAAKEKILNRHYRTIEKIEAEESPMGIWEMIEHVNNDINRYINQKGKIDMSQVMLHLNIGRSKAEQIVNFIKNQQLKPKTLKIGINKK